MFSTTRLMLFFDGRYPRYAFPVFVEYINPKEYPRKSNSPSGTLQMRVLSSLTVSFSFPMISRSRDAVCSFGDVIVEGRDLYGDGVNIAARLEGLAEPTHAPQQTTGYRSSRRSRACSGSFRQPRFPKALNQQLRL